MRAPLIDLIRDLCLIYWATLSTFALRQFVETVFFFFSSTGDRTQHLTHARQVLCHWATSPALGTLKLNQGLANYSLYVKSGALFICIQLLSQKIFTCLDGWSRRTAKTEQRPSVACNMKSASPLLKSLLTLVLTSKPDGKTCSSHSAWQEKAELLLQWHRSRAKGVVRVQKVGLALGCRLLLEEHYSVSASAESVTIDHKISYAHSLEVYSKIENNLL